MNKNNRKSIINKYLLTNNVQNDIATKMIGKFFSVAEKKKLMIDISRKPQEEK